MDDPTTTAAQPTPVELDRPDATGPLFYPLCLLVVIAVYLLAPGPIVKLLGYPPPQPIQTAYAPITYLADRSEALTKFYEWYMEDLWRVR